MASQFKKISEIEFMTIISAIMGQDMDYFNKGTVLSLTINKSGSDVKMDMAGVFESYPSIECVMIKLIHNITLMANFVEFTFSNINDYRDFMSRELKPNNTYFLKIKIDTERVNIVEKKGFGLILYNETDMCKSLENYVKGYKNFLGDYTFELLRNRDFETKERIDRVITFINNYKHKQLPNLSLKQFIEENYDVFSRFISE